MSINDACGRARARRGGDVDIAIGCCGDGGELPTGETVVSAVPGGGGERTETSERGPAVECGTRSDGAGADLGTGAREIQWHGGRAIRADARGRALGERGRRAGPSRYVAAVDGGGRSVESRAKTEPASPPPRAQSAFRRVGAARWQLSSLVWAPRAAELPVNDGRRCDGPESGPVRRTRNHLGYRRGVAGVDRAAWDSPRPLHRLEKRLWCARRIRRNGPPAPSR
jgi:hypothetical protein